MRYHLGMGGNIGDVPKALAAAGRLIEKAGARTIKRSSIYRTEPVGKKRQPWFLNMTIEVETEMSPWGLLSTAKDIERRLERKPGPGNGPRPIDIDILLAEESVLRTPGLVIPHPRMAERRFVLVPMVEIAPRAIHPVLKKSMKALLRMCPDTSRVDRVPDI